MGPGRNHTLVIYVIYLTPNAVFFGDIIELTPVRSLSPVRSAVCLFRGTIIFVAMAEFTQGKNHFNVNFAVFLVAIPVILLDIKEFILGRRIMACNSSLVNVKQAGSLWKV